LITFDTTTPKALLTAVKAAIDTGKVVTWTYNADGYFTHSPDQWKGKAWLLPSIVEGTGLQFGIVRPKNGTVTSEVYAVYHGRFIEMMLSHFDTKFTDSAATAMPTAKDKIRAA